MSALLDTGYSNLRNLIIGKMYSSSDLAFYNQADKFPKVIVTNINTSIDSVLLPTMSSAQDDRERVKNMTRRAIKYICHGTFDDGDGVLCRADSAPCFD